MTTPAPAPAAPAVPGRTLSIVAIILAFLAPLIGAILGFVARSQAKAGNAPTGLATAAIVIGLILTVLYLFLVVGLPLILAASGLGTCTVTIDGVAQPC
ncbi:MAG: DUF4190 domain-containing protein [Microbacteriaceae bacterium]